MSANAALVVLLCLVIIVLCHALMRRNEKVEAALDELYLWRTHCDAVDRWLAEFPDVTDALGYLRAKAQGAGGTDMVYMREMMRCRKTGARVTRAAPAIPQPFGAANPPQE